MTIVIGVVGNPNCGKSTLFNILTGARQEVGNWPGVTVEKKTGRFRHQNRVYELVDLPGVYSLGATVQVSEDERVARDFVLSGAAQVIVNIVDASNLERNLYLTTQLLEMQVPIVVALNMVDIAARRGLAIDRAGLERALGCPVIEVVASRGTGIEALKRAITAAPGPGTQPRYAPEIEAAVAALMPHAGSRWRALKLIEGDPPTLAGTGGELEAQIAAARDGLERALGEDSDILIADARFGFVTGIVSAVLTRPHDVSRTMSDRIDRVVLNRWLGIPIFLAMMYLMFFFTISIGGAFIDFFDIAVGAVAVDGFGRALSSIGLPEWLVVLLADGVGGGIQTVATFIPIIAFLYLFLSVLEDSGYMARAAFVMDRAMRFIGLPGKSFVPLIVGFGCNVPAIMATRTLESRRDRLLTVMMAPFMSCGARLPVYALFAAAFFPETGQNLVFLLYVIGIAAAVLTGLLLKNTVLKGDASPFIMELPPYHLPTFTTVILRAWDRLKAFIVKAGRVIVPVVVVLNFLNSVGTDGSFGHQDETDSVLSAIGRGIVPVFRPMGMTDDNWPAAVGVFTGILAKEAVIGTLNALYTQLGVAEAGGEAAEEEAPGIGEQIATALATIPANLADAFGSAGDPLGIDVSYTAEGEDAVAEELEVAPAAFRAMEARFDGQAGAFAYLLMILLYMPCVAAVGAIWHEVGWRWTAFSAGWTTGLGWTAATLFYQGARFGRDPAQATLWIAFCLALLAGSMAALWAVGHSVARRRLPERPPLPDRIGGAA
ncbi:Fe(2+) transporter permease subunit FeoB [Paracoccus versutus]|uniref:Fe(2+) transporter permease subunit FeoB n=1 Tax=Paracoccus versutus TaxID=34007 RepID=UPI000DF8268D|nr:Fe(2+) transporter permease subunit FeoB [Paracoccus versutus]RDD68714.1 Fe(2+) transporter permease subunit FeoB [Paracoccus versutus]